MQNSPLESSCVVVALIENYSTSKPLKVSPEKITHFELWHCCGKWEISCRPCLMSRWTTVMTDCKIQWHFTHKSLSFTNADYQTKTMKGTDMEDYRVTDKYILLLLIPQSFNLLTAFHLQLLQAIFPLLCNCQLLCSWRLALNIVVQVFPQPFFLILLLQGCLVQTRYA